MDKENKATDVNENEELEQVGEKQQENIGSGDSASNVEAWKVVGNNQHKGSNVFKAAGLILAIVIILGGMGWSGMKLYDLTQAPSYNKPNGDAEKVVRSDANTDTSSEDVSEEEESATTVDEAQLEEINSYIHHMANTIILAIDGKINGTKQITMESIDEALTMVKGVDEYLYEGISKWKEGDFSNGVEIHNYVWKNLDGEIGKAKSLDENAIEAIKINLGL